VNQGATCYLNSLLQCLYQNVPFRVGIYQFDPGLTVPTGTDGKFVEILSILQNIFTDLNSSVKRRLTTVELTTKLGLDTGEQQDPQEFTTLFLNKIEVRPSEERGFSAYRLPT